MISNPAADAVTTKRPPGPPASAEATPLAGDAVTLTVQERERQQNAWWYLIVLAFLILAAETVFSNRYYRAATPTRG